MTPYESDILSDLIRVKRECLLQLRDMGRRQKDLIEEGNMTTLMDVLAAKQRPLMALQRIERALDSFRNQDPEKRQWRLPEARAQCADQVQECDNLLAEIVSQEKDCEAALVKRRDEAAARLQGAHLAGRARSAYLPRTNKPMGQLDLFSEQ
ncbi:MAG TPA: hypothetical protein VIH42_10865 [Thermoguttaceae bacterium]